MPEFQPGDVVQLKSGGPKMTVDRVAEFNGVLNVWCEWFEGTNQKVGHFPVTSLELASGSTLRGA